MGMCVFLQHYFFKETSRQEIQTYRLKSSAKWRPLCFFIKKFSAKSLPKPNCKWISQLLTNKLGNPVNGCPVFLQASPRNHGPLGRDRRKNILQSIFGCTNILQFRLWTNYEHSHDNPSFTKPLIISINGVQTLV